MPLRSSTTAFAKSTRPEIGGVVQREALYARLDATAARTVAWISAPPGFGKTTLAASYLEARSYRWAWYQIDTDDDDGESFFHYLAHAVRNIRSAEGAPLPVFGPEHQADIASFARRFFRALFKGAVGPVAVALDNLHELAADSPLRQVLEAGLPEVPRQCCVIVTSRTPPPVGLSRLQPSGQMVCLAADDLRLTPAELDEMARLRSSTLLPEALAQVHERTEGWAAALVLMIEHHKLAESLPQLPVESTPRVVFDYLAGEIFERFDASTQDLLLHIACMPRVTLEVAHGLTGQATASRILFNLAHNDYFVRELVGPDGRVFVVHPLLREFLLRRAQRERPEVVGPEAIRRAARLLRDSGQLEDAMVLFIEGGDWPEAAALAVAQAEALLAQGRNAMLVGWLELLPPHVIEANPSLLYAHGAALARLSPRAARRRFEEANDAYERRNDRHGMARSCVGVIESLLHEFDDLDAVDRWLVEFERCRTLASDAGSLPVPVPVLVARLWREPSHPALTRAGDDRGEDRGDERGDEREGERDSERDGERDPARALLRAISASLRGDFARAAAILRAIEPTHEPRSAAGLAAATAACHVLDGQAAAALDATTRGLAPGTQQAASEYDCWLHLLSAAALLQRDDLEGARRSLVAAEAEATRRGDRAFLHVLQGWLASASGNPGLALREAKSAALLALEAGIPWAEALARLAMVQLLAATDDRQSAQGQMRAAEALAERTGSPLLRLATSLTRAGSALLLGDEAGALAPLQSGLGLARELGVHHVPGLPADLLGKLCALALRRGIATEHARLLVSAAHVAPPADALRLRQWPWAFEITTLGRFGLQRGGEPIEFSAKGPGRPVELLKLLVSLGGADVRVEQLADALWPHVDADYAHQSFTATLHRLRRILGGEDTLKLRDGRLSLNSALFWLDLWALDEVLSTIDTLLRESGREDSDAPLHALLDEALVLYRGAFLAGETEHSGYVARREQLRGKLLRGLARAARHLESRGRGEAAVDAYLRIIDADEQCEAFYRNLMLCQQRLGDKADALATYDRLRAVLAAASRTEPSPETRAIHTSLLA